MELGEKLRQARIEAGLSQRELCGEEITRNMLSLIENGSAKPSMNTLKYLGGIDSHLDLIASHVLEPICDLKTQYMGHRNPRLHTDEVLLALTISALTNPVAQKAKEQLKKLSGCEAHFTVILSDEDEKLLRRLGIHVSFQPTYETSRLYHK